jgi:DNA topoisomerase-1
MDYYGWALVDGSCEKMANFLVEPPGLFRGRGEQPLSGTIKKRIYAEDITLNVGDDEPVPICTQPGHCWGEIVNNNEGTWLAYYKVRKNTKYVF